MLNTIMNQLDAVLAALDAILTNNAHAASELREAAIQLDCMTVQALARLRSGLDEQQRAPLARKLGLLGSRLAALEQPMRRASGAVAAATVPWCSVALTTAARLSAAMRLSAADADRLISAAKLIVGAGPKAIECGSTALEGSSAAFAAQQQLSAAAAVLDFVEAAGSRGMASAVSCFAPDAATRWLAATTRVLEQGGEGVDVSVLEVHSAICYRLLGAFAAAEGFQPLQAAVAADPDVQRQLAEQLVLRNLPAAGAALLAHVGGEAPAADVFRTWLHVSFVAQAMNGRGLAPAVASLFTEPRHLAEVQRVAVRLADALPLEPPADVPAVTFANTWRAVLNLLHRVQSGWWRAQEAAPAAAAAQCAASWHVLRLLPRLAQATVGTQPGEAELQARLGSYKCLADLLARLELGSMRSAKQAQQLLAAADAALGLLPWAHEVWVQRGAASGQLPPYDVGLAREALRLCYGLNRLCSGADHAAAGDGSAVPLPGSTEEQEGLYLTAVQLHMTACRAVNWAATAASPAWIQDLGPPFGSLPDLQRMVGCATNATLNVVDAEKARCAGNEPRVLMIGAQEAALWAAQWHTHLVVLASLREEEWESAEQRDLLHLAILLFVAAACGPAALCTQEWPQPALRLVAAAFKGRHPGSALEVAAFLLGHSGSALHNWAAMVSAGVLTAALELLDAELAQADFESPDDQKVQPFLLEVYRSLEAAVQQMYELVAAEHSTAGAHSSAAALEELERAADGLQRCHVSLKATVEDIDTQEGLAHACAEFRRRVPPVAEPAARLVLQFWQEPDRAEAAQLELAQAAATRSCAYLGCANLQAGAAPGKRCSGCRVARYCGTECSHADWRAGHRRMCKALAAAQQPAAAQGGT